jgi:hypothetical protein
VTGGKRSTYDTRHLQRFGRAHPFSGSRTSRTQAMLHQTELGTFASGEAAGR